MIQVGIIGVGYVGLSLATSLLNRSVKVIGFENSSDRVDQISNLRFDGTADDKQLVERSLNSGSFIINQSLEGINSCDYIFLCLPTPINEEYEPDFSILKSVCQQLVALVKPGQVIIMTSTSFVGTTREFLVVPLEARGFVVGLDVFIGFSPERVDPGNNQYNQEDIPRVVAGATKECLAKVRPVIELVTHEAKLATSLEAAEMTKLVENTFRAVNIAWINEMENLADQVGLNIQEVIQLASTKPYGFMKFTPGPGVGGHCIPADPHYLLRNIDREIAPLTNLSMARLHNRPHEITLRALKELGDYDSSTKVLIWGVAYKPNVSDVRDSPALVIFSELEKEVGQVDFYDPHVKTISVAGSQHSSTDGLKFESYDLVIIHTIHREGLPAELLRSSTPVFDATFSGLSKKQSV